jgi:hypothetical protein
MKKPKAIFCLLVVLLGGAGTVMGGIDIDASCNPHVKLITLKLQ